MSEPIFNATTMEMEYESSGLEELPDVMEFDCRVCGRKWRQTYIVGVTDI